MSEGYIIGGGGRDLNFKVIAVASESALPTSAEENTIAVITTAAITSYVFSSTVPTSPVEGMVWFATGTASTVGFNAIKKDGLWVYPTGCQQYVSGAWASKVAKIYQNGAWRVWSRYLYNAGDECVDETGGWIGQALGINSTYNNPTQPNVANANGKLTASLLGTSNTAGGIVRPRLITDLTNVSTIKLTATYTVDDAYTVSRLCVWSAIGAVWDTNVVAQANLTQSAPIGSGDCNALLDVSSLTGTYWVGFGLYNLVQLAISSIELR